MHAKKSLLIQADAILKNSKHQTTDAENRLNLK